MKTRFALSAILFTTALALSLPAAEVAVDISSFAPRDPEVVLKQIELNVMIKQYERIMDDYEAALLQAQLGPEQDNLSNEQKKNWDVRATVKLDHLQKRHAQLREHIIRIITEANEKAEKLKLKVDTKPAPIEVPGK